MRNGEFYAAVFGIIKDDSGKYLFQRRKDTGFNDGLLQFPSGHIEGHESYSEALIREMKEEINIDILPNDIEVVHIMHRESTDRMYFDIFLEIKKYSGELKNLEPEKCSEILFTDKNDSDVVDLCTLAIEKIESGLPFSEMFQ